MFDGLTSVRDKPPVNSNLTQHRRPIAPRWHVIPPPARTPAVIGLVLQARAGDAAGTLLIDSSMIDLLRVKSGELQIFTKTRLAPGRRLSLAHLEA